MKGRWETRTDTDDAMLSRRLRSLQVAYAACGDDYCRRYCNPNGRRPRSSRAPWFGPSNTDSTVFTDRSSRHTSRQSRVSVSDAHPHVGHAVWVSRIFRPKACAGLRAFLPWLPCPWRPWLYKRSKARLY